MSSIVLFMGCSQGRFSLANLSSQCIATLAAPSGVMYKLLNTSSSLSKTQLQSVCTQPSNYACTVRTFSPNAVTGKSVTSQCSTVAVLGKPCLNVETQTFYSGHLANSSFADQRGFLPGRELNRSEYSCYNKAAGADFAKIVGEGDTLDSALTGAYSLCSGIKGAGG